MRGGFTYGSLFSGVGLLDLGVERAAVDAGIAARCTWQVEIDPFCRAVLAKHWPEVVRYEDVSRVGRATDLLCVDLIVGGFPCQDVSLAGARAGLAGVRSGLWYEYFRIVDELRPRAVIVENVLGLVRGGLDDVVSGLCGIGYEVEATRIRASDLGAPQRRERIFILAYANGGRQSQQARLEREKRRRTSDSGAEFGISNAGGVELRKQQERPQWETADVPTAPVCAAKSRMGRVPHGRAAWLDEHRWPAPPGEQYEWEPPRALRDVPHRFARLKALGNAVVPQCAYVAARRFIDVMTGHAEVARARQLALW